MHAEEFFPLVSSRLVLFFSFLLFSFLINDDTHDDTFLDTLFPFTVDFPFPFPFDFLFVCRSEFDFCLMYAEFILLLCYL